MGSGAAAGTVRFAECSDGREVAYRVLSDAEGPVIVHTHITTFPMEMLGEDPMYDRFHRALGLAGMLVLFGKPCVGASARSSVSATTTTRWPTRSSRYWTRSRRPPDGVVTR